MGDKKYTEIMYNDIKIGDKDSITKVITSEDVIEFSKISMDTNPVHIDEEFAKNSIFKKRIAHGFLGGSLISAVLGTKLPGANTIYLSQEMKFVAPVFIGDEITAEVTVVDKRDDKNIITLDTVVYNQSGKEVIIGKAVVKKN